MASAVENPTWNSSHSPHFFSYQPKKRLDRWHVCRDFQNGTCHKQENECEYAHPSPEKEIREGIVTICMDHVNDQCLRSNCKYLHPPKHICAQIHDHKKRPYPGFIPPPHSPTDSDQPKLVSNQEDCYTPQYPFPYHYFLTNPAQNHLYMSPYLSNQLNVQGQGYPNFQNQISTGLQVRGRTEYAQRAPKRSTSVSDVPTFRSANLSPDHVHLNTPPPYKPSLNPSTKFLSSFSSSPTLHNAPFQQAGSATLAAIPTITDTTDVATATTATPQIDSQTIGSMSYTEDTVI